MTNKKTKMILFAVFIMIITALISTYFIFFYTHNISFELADEMDNVQISADNRIYTHYYFIKDSKYSSWYDGEERFRESFPNYDFQSLTRKNTHISFCFRAISIPLHTAEKTVSKGNLFFRMNTPLLSKQTKRATAL